MPNPTDLRAAFEYWMERYGDSFYYNQEYFSESDEHSWRLWQAAHKLGVRDGMERAAEVCEERATWPDDFVHTAKMEAFNCADAIRAEIER